MRLRRLCWGGYASLVGLASGCFALLTGCSDQGGGDIEDEVTSHSDGVIIGSNDLVKVTAGGANVPAKYQPYVNAFGKLTLGGGGSCTATHVGNGIAISAGHCWEASKNGSGRQNNVSCSGSSVAWGNIGNTKSSSSNCELILAMQQSSGSNLLDYAIFRVSPVPPDAIPVDFSAKAPANATLTIFSHPGGRALEWSQTCTVMSPSTNQFHYQCDTEPGSSGATVLNDTAVKVTGIHWGGGGTQNSATYILSTPIAEFLQPPDGGTGGSGGADGGKGGSAGAAGAAGGKADGGGDASDAAKGDASDAASDASGDAADGAGGTAGAAGASGAGGTAGASGAGGTAGTAGTAGAGGAGGKGGAGGAAGTGTAGSGGKGGTAGAGGATGGSGGSAGTTGGAAGTTGGTGGGSAGSSSGGKGGTGGSTGGSGGSGGTSDDGGCSCRIGAAQSSSSGDHLRGLLAALGVGLVGLRRGRRKSTRTSS